MKSDSKEVRRMPVIPISVYRELELVPPIPLAAIGEAIRELPDEPYPQGVCPLPRNPDYYVLSVDEWRIIYHVTDKAVELFAVVRGRYQQLH